MKKMRKRCTRIIIIDGFARSCMNGYRFVRYLMVEKFKDMDKLSLVFQSKIYIGRTEER